MCAKDVKFLFVFVAGTDFSDSRITQKVIAAIYAMLGLRTGLFYRLHE